MRLDHLLSKEEEVDLSDVFYCWVIKKMTQISGVDALVGHTRSHPEHDG